MNRLPALIGLVVGLSVLHSGLAQPVDLLPTGANEGLRWMDIANNVYSGTFQASYSYDDAAVAADTDTFTCADGLERTVILFAGSGLKPNFAYQLKLEGKPTYFYSDGDDWANEQLGYAGRWWLIRISTRTGEIIDQSNSDDTEYEYWKDRGFKDARKKIQYVFTGYLLFGYVVTDESGNIPAESGPVLVNSALHVLWKESQRVPGINDSLSVEHTIAVDEAEYGYDGLTPVLATEAVYGEWEPTRDLPGELVLPDGIYSVALIVTEESFHSAAPLGGNWQTVLAADSFEFAVGDTPPPPPPPAELGSLSGTVTIGGRLARKVTVGLIQDGGVVRTTMTNPKGSYSFQDLAFGDYEIECDGLPVGSVTIDGDIALLIVLP